MCYFRLPDNNVSFALGHFLSLWLKLNIALQNEPFFLKNWVYTGVQLEFSSLDFFNVHLGAEFSFVFLGEVVERGEQV